MLELDFVAQYYLDEVRWLGSLKFISSTLDPLSNEAIAIEEAIAILESEILVLDPKITISEALQENGLKTVLASFLKVSEVNLLSERCPSKIKPILQELIG